MPNDCWNTLTIKGSDADINNIYEKHLLNYINMKQNKLIKIGKKAIRLILWNPWEPNYDLLNLLKNTYPNIWIKNEWISEDGTSGIWIYNDINNLNAKTIKFFTWHDMCIEDEYYSFQ